MSVYRKTAGNVKESGLKGVSVFSSGKGRGHGNTFSRLQCAL